LIRTATAANILIHFDPSRVERIDEVKVRGGCTKEYLVSAVHDKTATDGPNAALFT